MTVFIGGDRTVRDPHVIEAAVEASDFLPEMVVVAPHAGASRAASAWCDRHYLSYRRLSALHEIPSVCDAAILLFDGLYEDDLELYDILCEELGEEHVYLFRTDHMIL